MSTTLTVQQVLDAIKADKTPKALFTLDDGNGKRCIYGGINAVLGISNSDPHTNYNLNAALEQVRLPVGVTTKPTREGFTETAAYNLGSFLMNENDLTTQRKATIARRFEKRFPELLGVEVTL